MTKPILKPQEIPYDSPESNCYFSPGLKPFLATPAAVEMYGMETIIECLREVQRMAFEHGGLDYIQVFEDPRKPEPLWIIEDGDGGAITALLPSDY
jgi:hypothetical protein